MLLPSQICAIRYCASQRINCVFRFGVNEVNQCNDFTNRLCSQPMAQKQLCCVLLVCPVAFILRWRAVRVRICFYSITT